jgi:hypothetical protein
MHLGRPYFRCVISHQNNSFSILINSFSTFLIFFEINLQDINSCYIFVSEYSLTLKNRKYENY